MKLENRINIFDCPFDRYSLEETVKLCLYWIKEDRRPHYIVGLNANNLTLMKRNPSLKEAVYAADLAQPDGVPVIWASRLLRTSLPERVNGTDLMNRLIEEADRINLRVFFLGAKQVVICKMVDIILDKYPGLIIAGYRNGYFENNEERLIIRQIRESQPDILFIGMPTPFKEIWSYKYLKELNVPVIHGVGGSFDVFAGFIHRAPNWMQDCGLEWFWRLIMEPRKMWKRYLFNNTSFILLLLKALHEKYVRGNSPPQ